MKIQHIVLTFFLMILAPSGCARPAAKKTILEEAPVSGVQSQNVRSSTWVRPIESSATGNDRLGMKMSVERNSQAEAAGVVAECKSKKGTPEVTLPGSASCQAIGPELFTCMIRGKVKCQGSQ